MKIHEAAENYLETILILQNRISRVRAIDIVNELKYSKPTVSIVLRNFEQAGLIHKDINGNITLSEEGMKIAGRIYERHQMLTKVLLALGVEEKTAIADACKIEHDISEQTFQKIKEHYEKYAG